MPEVDILFPQDMLEEIEAILNETGETFSDFVSKAVEDAIKDGSLDGR